ncbi:chemotaxis protein CheW [Sphingorhabdus contaminans]|uniref:chemotaxis protein CheW n=1 Tax=Sphingorhabdus contaminans TaxID=1343899 RepID=UPI003D2B5783
MPSLFLIAHIHGCRVAINSDQIESIVNVPDVIPVPHCDPRVAGLFALRSRVLTLIDSQYVVTGERRTLQRGCLAVVVEIAGHHYGLAVDKVEDVVPLSADKIQQCIQPDGQWQSIVSETVEIGDQLVMILDPARLVAREQLMAA